MADKAVDPGQEFLPKRFFVKDFSFEAPGGANTFTNPWDPEVTVDLDVTNDTIGEDFFEVILTLTVTVANAGTTAFMIEIFQGGIFFCRGYSSSEMHRILHTVCPNLLFPYASQAVDDMTLKGSFPALMLEPVNFDALYSINATDEDAANGRNGD